MSINSAAIPADFSFGASNIFNCLKKRAKT